MTGHGGPRRKIPNELKDEAVKALDGGMKCADVCAKFGISSPVLYSHRQKLRGKKQRALVKADVKPDAKGNPNDVIAAQAQSIRDAMLLLGKAKHEVLADFRAGRIKDLDQPTLLSMLALSRLQGGSP